MLLKAVILGVPPLPFEKDTPRESVKHLRKLAREAASKSAEASGIVFDQSFPSDQNGAPLPVNNYNWSITHTKAYVAGVISKNKIGIDIEKITNRGSRLHTRTADKNEWIKLGEHNDLNFFRLWTAKEATLKAVGTGISGLQDCKVIEVPDKENMILHYKGIDWIVEHYYVDEHIVAITKNDDKVEWIIEGSNPTTS